MVIQLPPPTSTRGDLKTKTHTETRIPSGRDSVAPKSAMASSRRDTYDESRYSVRASDAGTSRPAPSERRDQTTRKTADSETAKTDTRRDDESRTRDPYDSVKTGHSTVPPSRSGSVRDSAHRTRDTESKQPSTSRPSHESTRARESHAPPSRTQSVKSTTQSVKDSGSHTHSTVRDPYDSVRTGGVSSKSRTETAKKTEHHPTGRRMESIREDEQESHRKTHHGSSVSKAGTDHGSTRQSSRSDDRSAVSSRSSSVHESSHSTARPTDRTSKYDDRSAMPSRSSTVRESSHSTARATNYDSRREPHSSAYGSTRHEHSGSISRHNTFKESSRRTLAPYDSRGRDSNYASTARVTDDLSQLSLNNTWDRKSRGGSQSMAMVPHSGAQRVKIPDESVEIRIGHLNQKVRERLFDAVVVLDLKTGDDWHAIINILEKGELKTGELLKFAKWGKKNDIFSDGFASSGKFADRALFDFDDSDDDSSDDDDDDYRLRRKDRGARYSYYEKITVERVRYRKRK